MGLLKLVSIYESVQRVLFYKTPSPSPKAYYKMLIKTNFVVCDFRKKRTVVSNPSPPLPYPQYAFINVDNFEQPRVSARVDRIHEAISARTKNNKDYALCSLLLDIDERQASVDTLTDG